jgi:hypothetical protein
MSDQDRIKKEQEEKIRQEQAKQRAEQERKRTELNEQIKKGVGSGDRPKR